MTPAPGVRLTMPARPEGVAVVRQALAGMADALDFDPAVLADRLRADPDGRPALTAAGTVAEVAEVLAARAPFYRAVADATIDTTGRTATEVADAILAAWTRLSGGRP